MKHDYISAKCPAGYVSWLYKGASICYIINKTDTNITYDQAEAGCRAAGPGFHLYHSESRRETIKFTRFFLKDMENK